MPIREDLKRRKKKEETSQKKVSSPSVSQKPQKKASVTDAQNLLNNQNTSTKVKGAQQALNNSRPAKKNVLETKPVTSGSRNKPSSVSKPATAQARNYNAEKKQAGSLNEARNLLNARRQPSKQMQGAQNALNRTPSKNIQGAQEALNNKQRSKTYIEAKKEIEKDRAKRNTTLERIVTNTPKAIGKGAKDAGSEFGITFLDALEGLEEQGGTVSALTKAQVMNTAIYSPNYEEIMKETEPKPGEPSTQEFLSNQRKKLQSKRDLRQAEWDERTKDAKGLEKAYYGAVESGTGMTIDQTIGTVTGTGQAGALGSMWLRTYGATRGQAEKEGASESEDRLYAGAQGTKEVLTELMFPGVGLAKKAYGKAGLPLAEKATNAILKGLTGRKASIAHGALRLLGGAGEENLEEVAGWGLDPLIKEWTYGKNVRQRYKEALIADLPEATSKADAEKIAAYFATDQFEQDTVKAFMDEGLSEKDATELAELYKEFYAAYYSGDEEKLDEIAGILSGQKTLSKDSWDYDELADTIASTTLLTMTTGVPGTVTTSVKGNQIFNSPQMQETFGENATKVVADAVKNVSDPEMALKAEAMSDRLASGKDLTGTQKYELYQGYVEKVRETAKKEQASNGVISKAIKEENLVPTAYVDAMGNRFFAKDTQKAFDEKNESALDTIEKYIMSDNSISEDEIARAEAAAKAVADLHVGALTIGGAHEFAFDNTVARETLKREEGIDLNDYIVYDKNGKVDRAKTNEKTETALFELNAKNAIEMARAETETFIDDTKGEIDTDLMARMNANGQSVWKSINQDLDPRNISEYLSTAYGVSYYYAAGLNTDMNVDEAISEYSGGAFKNIDNTILKRAFAAGARDRAIEYTPGYGQTVKTGDKIALKKTKAVKGGELFIEVAEGVVIPDSTQAAYQALADATNMNIHLVDTLSPLDDNGNPMLDKQGNPIQINGQAVGNDIYLNINAKAEKNLGYVFMHEMTHQIKQYAPNEYKALENLVRDRWFKKDYAGMQAEIQRTINLYSSVGNQNLTEEEAMEEIIANAMAEAIDDSDFAAEVCEQDLNLGQQILNSIRAALRSIRQMFAGNEFKNERFHKGLLTYLDILSDAERMWINALAVARENKANGLIADWQSKANKQNSTRLSVAQSNEENRLLENMRYSVSEADINELDQTNSIVEDENGNDVARFESNGSVSFSISSYENEGRDIYKKYLDKLVADGELSQKEADDMLRELETIYNISKDFADTGKYAPFTAWSEANVVRGKDGKPVFSAIKKNSEYKMNIDFSTICKKRRTLDAVFREMIRRGMFELPELDLNKEESAALVVNINNLIREHKFEAACALCFVEARRYRQQQTAKTFTDMWNGLVETMYKDKDKIGYFNFGRDDKVQDVPDGIHTMKDSELDLSYIKKVANEKKDGKLKQTAEAKAARLILNNPEQRKLMRVGDMMASTGFENMQIENPELMKVYNSKKGTGGAKSSFGDVQYLNEIIKSKTFDRQKAYDVSGVRIQSFSDYVPRMVFDYVQVIADLAAKKLPAHAYTKEPLFVYQFGLTGAKINLSLVPDVVADGIAPGLDADGNYIWNEEGTFPYKEAMKIQEAEGYKDNCGTIAVGISDEQIMKMLADPTIQMIIPYHKSSLNPIVAAMTNVDRFTNYEDFQNTKNAEGKAVKTDFPWDKKLFALTHYTRGENKGNLKPKSQWGNVQDLVKEYAEWCESKNYTPKFSQFLYQRKDNKIDGDFVLDENGNKVINPGYYKLLEDFALLDNDGNFKPQGDVQMRFPTENDAFGSMKSLIEQGLSEDAELEAKRSAEINGIVDEIEDMMKNGTLTEQSATSKKLAKKFSITPEMDAEYMSAVNSGNMDTAQRLVDQAAKMAGMRVAHRYHGSMNATFTKFDKSYAKVGGNSGAGFYFSTARDDSANHYADVEGADNYFKWSELAEQIYNAVSEGTWEGYPELGIEPDDIETYEDATEAAKKILNKEPGVYDVYLNYKNPYVRNYGKSTDLFEYIMNGFDESIVDRDDYDSEEDYEDDLMQYRDEYFFDRINEAVYAAYDQIENYYDYNDLPPAYRVVEEIAGHYDYDLTWDSIEKDLYEMHEIVLSKDGWGDVAGDGTRELTRAIIEALGFDAIVDKEVSSKFGQLSREMQTDTEHIIVFRPEQIKLSDPVTYAEDGSVIPLSERFDPTNDDIRYSLPTQDSDGNILTDGQMEYFKNSQARDEKGRLVPVYHTTNHGGFTIFDPSYSNDKRSLFFSNSFSVSQSYAEGASEKAEFREPEEIANAEEFPFIYNDVIKPGYYECYLNLENPLIIDGKGANWDAISLDSRIPADSHLEIITSECLDAVAESNERSFRTEKEQKEKRGYRYNDEDLYSWGSYQKSLQYRKDAKKAKKNGIVFIKTETGEMLEAKYSMKGIAKAINTYYGFDELDTEGVLIANKMLENVGKGWDGHYRMDTDQLRAETGETHSTREWAAIAESEGYDGVIFRNIVDIGTDDYYDNELASDIYVAFSSNQIKDINNENPTENPDIRFSVPEDYEIIDSLVANEDIDIDDIPLADDLAEEGRQRMARSKDEFIRSKNLLWNEKWLTEGKVLKTESVERDIRRLIMATMAKADTDKAYKQKLVDDMVVKAKEAFKLMKEGHHSKAAALLWDASVKMIEDVHFIEDTNYVLYKDLRDYLRTTPLRLGEKYWSDVGYANFRRRNRGRLKLLKGETNIDSEYQILQEKWREWFDEEEQTDVPEQLLHIEEVLDALQPYRVAYTSEEAERLAADVAEELYDIVYEAEAYKSVADTYKEKFDEKAKALKQRHREAKRQAQKDINKLKKELEKAQQKADRQQELAERWEKKYKGRVEKDKQDRKESKEKKDHRHQFESVLKEYDKLCKWVLEPTKDKNVPEEFRKSLADFLQTLDLQTENSKKLEEKTGRVSNNTFRLRELKDRLMDLSARKSTDDDAGNGSSLFEIDGNTAFILQKLTEKVEKNGGTVDALDTVDIENLKVFIRVLIRNIERYKQVRTETKMAELTDVAGRGVEFMLKKYERDGSPKERKGVPGWIDTINATSLTPAYLFERLGPLKEMYDVLRHNGFDKYIRNEKVIIDRLTEILGKYYKGGKKPRPGSDIEEWRDERSAQTIELENGKSVTMSVAQIMSLYCLCKRGTQATDHMTEGGITLTPIQTASKIAKEQRKDMSVGEVLVESAKIKGKLLKERYEGKDVDSDKYVLTGTDMKNIIARLTTDQIKVADELQELMSVDMAKLGNEAHRDLYGYEMFGEANYFPIKVSGEALPTEINNIGEVVEKIKSFGFTKPVTPNANKTIEIGDIFSIVADHCNGMNLYNAYLVPITDFMKVLNYRHTLENGDTITMKEAIKKAYGPDMLKYILNLMKDINGIKADNRGGLEGIMNDALGRAKKTAVFGNIRVALQQPTAIVRALAEIDAKYLTPFLNVKLNAIPVAQADERKGIYEEMYKYCPIAQWKAWGYYDTYMGRDIEDVMMNNWSVSDVALSGIYGALDNMTWSAIWQAVKAEQADLHPNMDHNSEEFLQMCGRRASDVFDKTQVVDSTFHRSDAMRNKQVAVKVFTAFMAEPTLTLNVFRAGLYNAAEAWKNGDKTKASKILSRAIGVVVLQAVVVSAAQAFADAWRGRDPGLPWGDDDDDDKDATYWERWWHNFVSNGFENLHLEKNMYLVKDVSPYIDYIISLVADHNDWNPTLRAVMGWDQEYLYNQNNLVFAAFENIANGTAQFFKKLEKGDDYIDYNTKEPKKWYDIIQKIMSGVGTLTGMPVGTLMRDFKPIVQRFLPGVYAADIELEKDTSKKDKKDKKSSKKKPEGESNDPLTNENLDEHVTEDIDAFEQKYQDLSEKAAEKAEGLSGKQRDDMLWDVICDGYTKSVAAGNMATINKMREVFEENGGDVEWFDAKITETMKREYKKTLYSTDEIVPGATARQEQMHSYLLAHGVSAEEISDICYRSYTARDLKAALRLGNEEYIMDELVPLIQAGLTYDDFVKIWENRNRGKNTYDGKYSDPKYAKSSGTYVWPTQGTITSEFGYRNAPTAGASTYHPAIDIAAPQGTPVVAADGGVVVSAGRAGGYGNQVVIQHDDGTVTYYSHLYSWGVKVGDTVAQGQQIGQVGSTGISTGSHLDFKVEVNGKAVDPMEYLNKKG